VRTATITTTILLTGLLSGLFSATAGQAQLWKGPAALEIQAKEQKGGSVAGGQVKLVCRSIDPPDGPPPMTLDAKGRVVVSGLAEGKWHIEVSRESYMTYQADIDVRSDRKPKVITTLQLNVPRAVHMMDVWFTRAKPVPVAAPAMSEPAVPVEPVVPAAPAPRPAPVPRTAPVEPERKPVEPAPAPVVPAPVAPPPAPSRPVPVPAPAPPVPTAPTVPTVEPPVPAPPPPSASTVRRRSFDDRTCFECKPGEAALSLEAMASDPTVRVLRVTLPEGTRYTGYRYEIQDGSEELDCLAGKDCPGGGRWPLDPVVTKSAGGTTVAATFEGGPATPRERRAVLTVYYAAAKK